ncbi:MAG: cytochrome c-type biogenesis protein CcmH [Chloroflexi bacterium]|nr:cytochrome c-type biogenesis protein CcmH [Chloroflexota bacterium]
MKHDFSPPKILIGSYAFLMATALLFFAGLPARAGIEDTLEAVENELMCQCGCSLTLTACAGTMTCDVAAQMRTRIKEKLSAGESKQQIVQYMVAQYGEKILSSPPKQGFNLTAWITPFAAILAGGVFIYFLLRTWLFNRNVPEENIALAYPVSDEERTRYQAAFEREFGKFKTLEEEQ